MNLLRKLLLPIVPVYYVITWVRNKLYDIGVKKSETYDFPVIVVGNLSVGGTGKSPMVEYLIRLLKESTTLATLSRGYKRKTKGFKLVVPQMTALEVGDEPLQFKKKFNDIIVGVDADRRNGIQRLRQQHPMPSVILLDDAYQHRKVKAGFYILLTAFYELYCDDIVLPTGNLREPKKGADRADVIIVTKCPKELSVSKQQLIHQKLQVQPRQSVLFSYIDYADKIVSSVGTRSLQSLLDIHFVLVTGIANPQPLVAYYTALGLQFEHKKFTDHHNFTTAELTDLQQYPMLVTTEKDYMRMADNFKKDVLWYQPIYTCFLENEIDFDQKVLEFVSEN